MTVTVEIIANAAYAAIEADNKVSDAIANATNKKVSFALVAFEGIENAPKGSKVSNEKVAKAISELLAANPIVDSKGNVQTMGKDYVAYVAIAGIAIAKDTDHSLAQMLITVCVSAMSENKVGRDICRAAVKGAANIADAIAAVKALIPGKTNGDKFSSRINAARVNAVAAHDMEDCFTPTDTDIENIDIAVANLLAIKARKAN